MDTFSVVFYETLSGENRQTNRINKWFYKEVYENA